MDFALSPDQRALQAAAAELLADRATSELVRKAEGFDSELWHEMVAQGWPLLALAESDGGLGLTFVEVAVLAEQVGRHVAPAPYLDTALCAFALARSGAAPGLLERLTNGGVGAVAWHAGGAAVPVPFAPVADVLIIAGPSGVTGFELTPGAIDAVPVIDLTRVAGVVDPAAMAGGVPLGGADLAAELLDRAAVGLSAELVGGAARMLEVSVDYAKVREQFGRPIGSFQAVKHRCADMHVDVEGMTAAAYYAAWAVSAAADDAGLAASTAKSWCADAGTRVMASALQVHGGIGFTWEHDLHLYLKRTELSARLFGTADWHRERLIRLLAERQDRGDSLF
ncbi:MAG TPA: acyl-CoA dehydrogenase family protein [Mycobacteriales bacterium]|nr:acyl-CoA dehydrogenase family protein [Mycobacteriales bacterium]